MKKVVGTQMFALNHGTTAHNVAVSRVSSCVKAAANPGGLLKDCDFLSLHISVANEENCGGKRSDAAAYKICCRAIIRLFHRDRFTLSLRMVNLATVAPRDSI